MGRPEALPSQAQIERDARAHFEHVLRVEPQLVVQLGAVSNGIKTRTRVRQAEQEVCERVPGVATSEVEAPIRACRNLAGEVGLRPEIAAKLENMPALCPR
jgi:hypothetical protein